MTVANRLTTKQLPPIPAKHYFTIGEVSEICDVPPHVLRYWEQEFPQLKPTRRRGQRRYYTRDDVLLVRKIIDLLYRKKFTIDGAQEQLKSLQQTSAPKTNPDLEQVAEELIAELEQVLGTLESD